MDEGEEFARILVLVNLLNLILFDTLENDGVENLDSVKLYHLLLGAFVFFIDDSFIDSLQQTAHQRVVEVRAEKGDVWVVHVIACRRLQTLFASQEAYKLLPKLGLKQSQEGQDSAPKVKPAVEESL